MVRKDDDPMFLSDAINTQTKDDEEKKSEATPSEEPKKTDETKEKAEPVEEKKEEKAGVSMSDFLKPSGEKKPIEDDS